ncbi:MAG: hypothetical protein F6K09_05395 [Merismopedia sp. SIO2A8]|nr:hypothetical protein [Merismopedia sp. SIO2A8]
MAQTIRPSINTSIVSSVVHRIFRTRTISRSDQQLLMSLLSKSILSDTDIDLVNRIHIGLHDGRLRVVD